MGQSNSSYLENDRTVVVGLRPRCFAGCTGRSRGRYRDDFQDDAGLDGLPLQLANHLTQQEWDGFVGDIRALDDSVGPNKLVGTIMFVPLLGTHLIMLPGILAVWLPKLTRGMDRICEVYASRWHVKGLQLTRTYKREGKNIGVHCIRIEVIGQQGHNNKLYVKDVIRR